MRIESQVFSIVVVVLLWGLWGFLGKIALNNRMPPLGIFYAEVFVGFLVGVFLAISIFTRKGSAPWEMHWNYFGIMSGACLALGIVIYYFVLQNANVSLVVPITATYPVVTVMLSFIFLGERLSLIQWLSLFLIIVGLIFLLAGGE